MLPPVAPLVKKCSPLFLLFLSKHPLPKRGTSTLLKSVDMPRKRKTADVTSSANNGKGGFLMILSPAKTLDLSPMDIDKPIPWTKPECSLEKTKEVIQTMKGHAKSTGGLSKLLGISTTLAGTAKTYWDEMEEESDDATTVPKPCGFAFSGAAYKGLEINTMSKKSLVYLQNSLRIIDPLYGWLRPMDTIQPYRLEMATKNVFDDKSIKLNEYWKPAILESYANNDEGKIILNLASDEYAAAVDVPMVKIVFKHGSRVIAVHAKRARGLMVRYLAENNVSSLQEIHNFAEEGYMFQPQYSDDKTIVFDRPKEWKKPRTTKK